MRQVDIKYLLVCVLLALSGCISIPNSPTPRYYALSVTGQKQEKAKTALPPGLILGIGPVNIPEYLNRPQMVTSVKDHMLQFAQFDRWGEPLDQGLARLLREDLIGLVPGEKLALFPWNPSLAVKYQVVVEVFRVDSMLDGDLFLEAQWMLIDVANSRILIIKRSVFKRSISPHNYSGMARALSFECASLAKEIGSAITSLFRANPLR